MRELLLNVRVYVFQQGLAFILVDVFQQRQVQHALRRRELAAAGETVVDHRRVHQRRQAGLHQRRQLWRDSLAHLRIVKAGRRPGARVVVIETQVEIVGDRAPWLVVEHQVIEDARLQGRALDGLLQVGALQALIEPGVNGCRHFLCCQLYKCTHQYRRLSLHCA